MLVNLDSVHICTPPTVHYDLVKKYLLKGKHVICDTSIYFKFMELAK